MSLPEVGFPAFGTGERLSNFTLIGASVWYGLSFWPLISDERDPEHCRDRRNPARRDRLAFS